MMENISFKKIFSEKYGAIMQKYIERLEDLTKEYDVIIFMARKAICFYNSLIVQQVVDKNSECCILSSRALEYNTMHQLKGKKIALVDDVVVKGTSITKAMVNLKEFGINPDIYIAACDIEFIENESFEYKKIIKEPYVILSQIDICELATYITKFIEIAGCPYNIDQPIYKLKFSDFYKIKAFFERNSSVSITSKGQKDFGINSKVIHFKSSVLQGILPKELPIERVFVKIRTLYREGDNEIILLPFILLPEISYDVLDRLYCLIRTLELDELVIKNNVQSEYENKLNIFQYIFSNIFLIKYLEEMGGEFNYKKVQSNEILQFSKSLLDDEILKNMSKQYLGNIKIANYQRNSGVDLFEFNSYIASLYDLVMQKQNNVKYVNSYGQKIQKQVITLSVIENYFKERYRSIDSYALSNMIDVFIDRGIFVPSVVHTEGGEIVRAYKGGEVLQITENGMKLFSFALGKYLDSINKDYLDKIEYEKLCVIFFRGAYKQDILPNIDNRKINSDEGDYYEISYAKFGPRVSLVGGEKYEAGKKVLLADEMKDLELLELRKTTDKVTGENVEKYRVLDSKFTFDEGMWQEYAEVFAYDFKMLRKAYMVSVNKHNTDKIFYYVPTYNKFLTLVSIGNNEKEKLLSLTAEVYLFLTTSLQGLTVKGMLTKIRKRYDGFCSGIWKYSCYKQEDLLKKIFYEMAKYARGVSRCSLCYLTKTVDKNPNIENYIDECGDFLINLTYALFKMGQKYNINMAVNCSDFRYIYDVQSMDYFCKLDERYDVEISESEIENDLRELQMEAAALIDKCDVFLKEEAMFYNLCKSIFVIYSESEELPNELKGYNTANNVRRVGKDQYNYLTIFCEEGARLNRQLNKIVKECAKMETAKIILCNMEKDYEGVIYSKSISRGRNFDDFVEKLLDYESIKPNERGIELIICYKKNCVDINMPDYDLYEKEIGKENTVPNGYKVKRFMIETRDV